MRSDDGHFINFLEFLKEKEFHPSAVARQIQELRQNVQFVNCSNCGASINLESDSACPYCHSPMLHARYEAAAADARPAQTSCCAKPLESALPLKLASAKLQLETSLADHDRSPEWWSDAASFGLVQAV